MSFFRNQRRIAPDPFEVQVLSHLDLFTASPAA